MAQNSSGFICLLSPVTDSLLSGLVLLRNFHWFLFLFCFSVSQTLHSLLTEFLIPLVERETFHHKETSRKSQQFPVAELLFLFSLQLQRNFKKAAEREVLSAWRTRVPKQWWAQARGKTLDSCHSPLATAPGTCAEPIGTNQQESARHELRKQKNNVCTGYLLSKQNYVFMAIIILLFMFCQGVAGTWTDARKMLTRKYICMYYIHIFLNTQIYTYLNTLLSHKCHSNPFSYL